MASIAEQLERQLRDQCRDTLPLITARMVEGTQAASSRRTGALANSIGADDWVDEGTRFTSTIYAGRGLENPDVARFQDEGTGIYGPAGTRIVSADGGPLAFFWPGAGVAVTAKNPRGQSFFMSVAGHPGTHFFTEPMPGRYTEAAQQLWR